MQRWGWSCLVVASVMAKSWADPGLNKCMRAQGHGWPLTVGQFSMGGTRVILPVNTGILTMNVVPGVILHKCYPSSVHCAESPLSRARLI